MTAPAYTSAPRGAGNFLPPVPVQRRWRDALRIWWREVDKVLLLLIGLLMAIGIVAVAAASPASADQLSTAKERVADFMFFKRHIVFQLMGLTLMIGLSFLNRDQARRLGILVGAVMLALLFVVPIIGEEKNGAKRWINVGMSLQPSEFLKPGFAIICAWILSWRLRDPGLPVVWYVTGLMGLIAGLLMLQPNLGDAILFGGIWLVMVLLAGVAWQRIAGLIGAGVGALGLAYVFYDNARHRIDGFLGGGTAFDQVDLAQRTITAGGWTGTGLWLGVRKMNLPEAHTDYIFSVIGEEFGLITCGLIVLLYCALVLRVLVRLVGEDNLFALLAATGLITQFGGQAFINMLVNLKLFPSKGMTLPLISYGGSSTLAVCFTLGLLLAITRRNPFLAREGGSLRDLIERKDPSS
ncbi:cell division protein FtsW [Erythromicrobium ramosum]|uniref:Probable peptidoglycan glycosyltransferase FtsW n=1 Tax=Erythrobacter ramosus TaxID=35811 RepID=A0A6I4ULF8_9SPHN|nr:putative peptidoglycan glycosyltransferase FtsW [Erythrobacter ramosus]MBB3776830.1 cell division protein FtsW [Erythrobacter ramosus]MXP39682.1 cell division protein FtsW [Erythrobacter ramosus]